MSSTSYGPPPARARRNPAFTCFFVALGGLGLAVVTVVALVLFGVWAFVESPTGKKILAAPKKASEFLEEASKAPGTREMRAIGCAEAAVIDPEKMVDLIVDLFPDGGTVTRNGAPIKAILSCRVRESGPPTCDEVKAAYLRGVHKAPGPFLIQVSAFGKRTCECHATYDANGTKIPEP
jgi:hypothetical protein